MKMGVKKLGKLEPNQIALAVVKQATGIKSLKTKDAKTSRKSAKS